MDEAFSELKQFALHPPSIQRLALGYCQRNLVVVLNEVVEGGTDPVTVGMLDTGNAVVMRELAAVLSRAIKPVRLNADEIARALAVGFDLTAAEGAMAARLVLHAGQKIDFDPASSVAEMLNEILGTAVGQGASDVHIEGYEDDVDVRFRIDGILRQVATPLSPASLRAAVSRLKIFAGLDIAEHRSAQDGRIRATYLEGGRERRIDFRLSVVPGPVGEDATLRILDNSAPLLGLAKLGLEPGVMAGLEGLIANPEGLILVTGPTGSGKTTTLYSVIERIRSTQRKVLTVEDPIEYQLEKTNQKQVTEQMGFADYARAFMRQNPDVILIGEIRDEETADVAMRAAQTGHLVLSTLHTNDAIRAISRLRTLGVEPEHTAESLLGALSQRLVRRLCLQCREQVAPTADERRRLFLAENDGPFFRSKGCGACRDGYRGRVGLYELFVADDELADMIASGAPVHQTRARAVERGMTPLLDDALGKARAGLTSLEEVLRVMPYRLIHSTRVGRP